jgi:histidinol-phosphate aminotransferase
VLVLLDEAYREFVTDPAAVDGIPLLKKYPNLVVLRTFSKAYGLAGLRVGYAVGPAYILDAARATAVPLSVTEPAQRAALAALDNESELLERVAVLIGRRAAVVAGLADGGWTGELAIPAAQGNFVWLPTGENTAAAAELLEAGGIVARVFPPDGIRVSIGEAESVETLLRAAARVVETLRETPENAGLG